MKIDMDSSVFQDMWGSVTQARTYAAMHRDPSFEDHYLSQVIRVIDKLDSPQWVEPMQEAVESFWSATHPSDLSVVTVTLALEIRVIMERLLLNTFHPEMLSALSVLDVSYEDFGPALFFLPERTYRIAIRDMGKPVPDTWTCWREDMLALALKTPYGEC